jgi:hypothetical protein
MDVWETIEKTGERGEGGREDGGRKSGGRMRGEKMGKEDSVGGKKEGRQGERK